MHLNLDVIKETPIQDLMKKDKIALVLVLLKQLQPYLADHAPKNPTIAQLSQQKIASSDTAETLNRILDNINVQTKRSELGSRGSNNMHGGGLQVTESGTMLPPIGR